MEAPIDFDEAYREAASMELAPGVSATCVSYDRLIRLNIKQAGRRTSRTWPGSRRCGRGRTVNENERDEPRQWERGWDGHELAQMRRLANLPLAEKLKWLEEAHRLVEHLRQQRRLVADSQGEVD